MQDRRSAAAARSIGALGLQGASAALFLAQLCIVHPEQLRINTLSHAQRLSLVAAAAGAGIASAVASLVWYLRRPGERGERLVRLRRFTAPLALLGLLPLVTYPNGWREPLQTALLLLLFMIGWESALRASLSALPARLEGWLARANEISSTRYARFGAPALVGAAVLFYGGTMAYYSVLNHQWFHTMSYDLGQYDNSFFNALHGHPFRCTPLIRDGGNWSELRSHASFSLYLLLPFYALRPGPETLLVLQALFLGAGAVPLHRLTARHLGRGAGLLFVAAYLLYPPLHGANLFDFHFQPIAAVFTLFAIDWLDEGRRLPFALCFVAALGAREDIAIGFVFFGLFWALTREHVRAGLTISAIAGAYFVVIKFLVMPRFGSWWLSDIYVGLSPPGKSGFGGVLQTLIANPGFVLRTWLSDEKLRYALQILLPLACLPLRRLSLWLLLAPGAFFTLLTSGFPPALSIGFQYTTCWVPYLFPAAVWALQSYAKEPGGLLRKRAAVGTLVALGLLCTVQWGAIPPRRDFRTGFLGLSTVASIWSPFAAPVAFAPPDEPHRRKARDLAELAKMVPPAAKLAVSMLELPHLSTRLDCYSLRQSFEGADYILYATDSGWFGADTAQKALATGLYEEISTRPGLRLLARKALAPVR